MADPTIPDSKTRGLAPRQREVLAALVREYIQSGEPVGSSTLVRSQALPHSSATVRNSMSALEELGLLQHRHASGGRLPTDKGLRYFVDHLMPSKVLAQAVQRKISDKYPMRSRDPRKLMRNTSRMLSDFSRQCGVVLFPRAARLCLRELKFVEVGERKLLAALVMSNGLVESRIVETDAPFEAGELDRINNYLNSLCEGRELSQVRARVRAELSKDKNRYQRWCWRALELGARLVGPSSEDEVIIEGQSNLLRNPQLTDLDKLQELLRTIEEKRLVLFLLDQTIDADGVQVFIGSEIGDEQLHQCSLVAAAYGGDTPLGTLGIIGPASLDYPRLVPLVRYAAKTLTHSLIGEE
jgi:heat-inducible transcriptional repressor